ncbi:MAG: polyprenyl synthetase family protein [Firmicutes bacterium]|nr:polyprenyl synthetase family protein [Bacillota bacterium]
MDLFDGVSDGMQAVEMLLKESLQGQDPAISTVTDYLMAASGKRMRPALVLIAGQFGQLTPENQKRLVQVAAAVEMIHMATLVHDDIIDEAPMRRGQPSVRQQFSNTIAVLAGDLLFAQAFRLFAASGLLEVVDVAAQVVHVMCVGEISQDLMSGQEAVEEETYWNRIEAKTGYFLQASLRLGALATQVDAEVTRQLALYGFHVGRAFQVVDDLLDWTADPEKLGKAVGGDLASGVYTLPLIHTFDQPQYAATLHQLLQGEDGHSAMAEIKELLEQSGGFAYARAQALEHITSAQNIAAALPDVPAKKTLQALAEFILARDY